MTSVLASPASSRVRRRVVVVALIVALLLLGLLIWPGLIWPGPAQPTTTIQGQVTFEDGSPVPGARVTLEGPAAAEPRSTVTDADGRFDFRDVVPGPYRVTTELEGFSSQLHHFHASLSDAAPVRLVLTSGVIEEDILVTGHSSISRSAGPSWNAWVEIPYERRPEPVLRLKKGEIYHAFLDLSPFAHRRAGMTSASAGSTLRDELWRVFQEEKTHMVLQVLPMLEGGVLVAPQDGLQPATWHQGEWREARSGQAVRATVRLGNLFETPHRLDETATDWRAAADRARAAGLKISVKAETEGCGVIAYSIWDEDLERPLDHVLHTVAVGDARCPRTGQSRSLDAGFVQMLHAPTEERVAAALHLFEVTSDHPRRARTLAVYVPREPEGSCRIFHWQRPGEISKFFLKDPVFADSLSKARKDRDWDGYADLAGEVRDRLFPAGPEDGGTGCGGKAALQDLRRQAGQPGRTLYVRLVDFGHSQQLVPLGLLFALSTTQGESRQPFFAENLTVRQALPHRSQGNGERCIGDWRLVLPEKLSGYDEILLPPVLRNHKPQMSRVAIGRSFEDLEAALTGESADLEPEVPGRGLVVLAHHAGSALYFLEPGSRDDLGQKSGVWRAYDTYDQHFPKGSVAILSACETGDLSHDVSVVRALNAAGVDAVILSPFAVDTRFGVTLALKFSQLVVEAQDQEGTATLADLYDKAMRLTVEDLEKSLGSRARGMAREFLLAGDADIPLCPAPPA